MYDSVVIKKIGDIDIMLSRSTLYRSTWFTPLYYIVPFVCCYGGFILISTILCSIIENCNYNMSNALGISLAIGAAGALLIWVLNIGTKEIPSYSVYTRWDIDFRNIDIPMTTPEHDQIEICKAAKEIEVSIIRHIVKLEELEKIAARCK